MRFYGNKNDGVRTGNDQRQMRTKTLHMTASSERLSADSVLIIVQHYHPAGTSNGSDKCDLSKNSEIAPLTLGSMVNNFFYHLFYFSQEIYLSKALGEIYI